MTSLLLLAALAADRPNVLFIAVDDMRVELGCYGQSQIVSPHLDALAARGVQFDRAYCQQAVCNPSRASVLTGLRPSTLGVHDLFTHFRHERKSIVTLPQAFKRAGYHSRCIGKIFHNWVQPSQRGDAQSWSVPSVMHYAHHADDVPHVGLVPPSQSAVPRTERRDVPDDAYFDGRIADLAVDALTAYGAAAHAESPSGEGRNASQSPHSDPFFLAVGFWKPHAPFNAPAAYWNLYDRTQIAMPSPADAPADVPSIAMHEGREILRAFKDRPNGRPTDDETITLRHGYYAAISYVDAQIGRVLDALDRAGLRDSTIVVFWSDHGFHLGEQTLWAKTSNFELDARVPLIVATPTMQPGTGRRTDAIVELLDLYPTLCELAGIKPPHRLEGDSLVPYLTGREVGPTEQTTYAVTEHPRPAYVRDGVQPTALGLSIRSPRYRYTQWRAIEDGRTTNTVVATELYDLTDADIETENISGPAHAAIEQKLQSELTKLVRLKK